MVRVSSKEFGKLRSAGEIWTFKVPVIMTRSAACLYVDSRFDGSSALVFFTSVGATSPTTRPALSLSKFRAHSLYPVAPCVGFLGVHNPANPLITRERRNVLP